MFKKYFLHQITFISASTSKKKIASKEGNHTTEIIERERKKEKKKRAKGASLIFIHLCRKLRNSVPGRWLTKGPILIIDFHGFAERQKIVCGESHLNTTMGGSYTINNGEGSRIVSSVIIHPPPPPPQPTRDSIIRTVETKTQRPFPITDAMLLRVFLSLPPPFSANAKRTASHNNVR